MKRIFSRFFCAQLWVVTLAVFGGVCPPVWAATYTTLNNRKDFSISWGGAGNKFASRMSHGIIRRNTSIWEKGTGIWLDIDCVGNLIEENVTVGNAIVNAGYFYEISRDGILRGNVAFAIRDWQHVKPSTPEFGTVFSGNHIAQPAAGATPFIWGSRRYNTLADLEKNESGTAFGNAWLQLTRGVHLVRGLPADARISR